MQTGILGNNETLRRLWGGPLLDLVVKLNSESGPEWEEGLKRFLRKEDLRVASTLRVHVGTGLETPDEFRGALKQSGCRITHRANPALDNILLTREATEFELVIAGLGELTGKCGKVTVAEIFEGATRQGYATCPLEVVPQLCLQHPNQAIQAHGRRLIIGTSPFSIKGIDDGRRHVFFIDQCGLPLTLDAWPAEPCDRFDNGDWVFVRSSEKLTVHFAE